MRAVCAHSLPPSHRAITLLQGCFLSRHPLAAADLRRSTPFLARATEADRAEKEAADSARLAEESRRAAAEARMVAEEAAERAQCKAAETRLQRERVKAATRRLREERARAAPMVKVGPCIIC